MRPAPRKLLSEEELYAAALRALMRRAHSVWELRQALERRLPAPSGSAEKAAVRRVLDRLKKESLLDDARYARQFARYRAETRRQGRYRIARELRARGVPDRYIEAALAELAAETDEAATLRRRIERRLKTLRGPLDARKLAALYRSLLRAGFDTEAIRTALRTAARQDFAELSEPPPGDEE